MTGLLLIPAPSYTDGQTVFTLPAPLTVPCEKCAELDRCGRCGHPRWPDIEDECIACPCPDCTGGRVPYRGRIGIVVPCSTCEGAGVVERDDAFGGLTPTACPDCDGLGSLLVATATVTDCVPIVGDGVIADAPAYVEVVDGGEVYLWTWDDELDDHRHGPCLADDPAWGAERGRWAVLCEDVQPTTTCCPACWGWQYVGNLKRCGCCNAVGTCPPIPVAAQPEPWRHKT